MLSPVALWVTDLGYFLDYEQFKRSKIPRPTLDSIPALGEHCQNLLQLGLSNPQQALLPNLNISSPKKLQDGCQSVILFLIFIYEGSHSLWT